MAVTSLNPSRFVQTILATCCVPWDPYGRFDETLFRHSIRNLRRHGYHDLYVFGTAGEGHSVDDADFAAIARVFIEEVGAFGGEPMIGVINLSVATARRRIELAAELGCTLFQISLPSWGALNDEEVATFFRETCGRFPNFRFMHYNLRRAARVLRGADYRHLAAEHPNLVATKYGAGDPEVIAGLLRDAPELRHFFTELGFFLGGALGPCSLLASISASNPRRSRDYFDAVVARDFDAASKYVSELAQMLAELRTLVGSGPHIDSAYDKLIARLLEPDFPLALLPPWQGSTLDAFDAYRAFLERSFPQWLAPSRSDSS